jgi:hypothetical protein
VSLLTDDQLGRAWWARHSTPESQCWDFLYPHAKTEYMLTAKVEYLQAELERVKADMTRLQSQFDYSIEIREGYRLVNGALTARNERLAEALVRYGAHSLDCRRECICGLSAALASPDKPDGGGVDTTKPGVCRQCGQKNSAVHPSWGPITQVCGRCGTVSHTP